MINIKNLSKILMVLATATLLIACGNSVINLKNSGRDMSMVEDIQLPNPDPKQKPTNPNQKYKIATDKDGGHSIGGGSTSQGGGTYDKTPGDGSSDKKDDGGTPSDHTYDRDTVKV